MQKIVCILRCILRSSMTGNIVGIISLLIGIVGLIITIRTMKSAKRIEQDIKDAEAKTVDKLRFNNNKEKYIKCLDSKRKSIVAETIVTYTTCFDLLCILNDLKSFNKIISEEDMNLVEKKHSELTTISKKFGEQKKQNSGNVEEIIDIISDVLNILKKGEYAL